MLSAVSEGLDGDYNEDGIVDAADYTVWRDNLGAIAGTLPNDPDGGVIGANQYNTWRTNYSSQQATIALTGTTVPEPLGLAMAAVGLAMLSSGRRRQPLNA